MEVFLKFHETRSSQLVAEEESTLLEKGVPHPQECLGVCHEVPRAVQQPADTVQVPQVSEVPHYQSD